MHVTSHNRKPSGFTLIELLVTITLIAALAVGSFVGIRAGISAARRGSCIMNLKEIGVGMTAYTATHDGFFPISSHSGNPQESWLYTLQPYIGAIDKVLICPADPLKDERRHHGVSSYVMNEFIAVGEMDPFGQIIGSPMNHLPSLPNPQETITVFIGADHLSASVTSDHTHSRNWGLWDQVLNDIQPDRHRTGKQNSDHTNGSANYLYADGHVATIQASEFKARIEAQENPAIPPPAR
jgi:prepilin-type N-terminal cleavage/methylation domain-containing protein/prepilin-type processing-associated H-X9-DG protein